MIQISHPSYLFLLLSVIPVTLCFIWFLWWRKNKIKLLGDPVLAQKLMPDISKYKHFSKFMLIVIALLFLVVGVLDPLIGVKYEKVKREGVDIIVALDISKSMMAEDIKPSRLIRAKMFVSKFLDKLTNDRFGLIFFAGRAYLQMPLTIDYSAGKMYLANASTDLIPAQGTSIAEAVNMARKSFKSTDKKHKVLIIITDGEDHEGADIEAIEEATKEGIIVHTIGCGTEEGAPIPIGNGLFKKDNEGNTVITKLNIEMIKDLANKGNGKAYILNQGNEPIVEILNDIEKMEKKGFEERVFTDFEHQFQYFLLIALVLMVIEFLISDKKSLISKWFFKIKL
jgi:Ca-activated chloride channel homolog